METKEINNNQQGKTNKVDEFLTDTTEAIKKRISNLKNQAHIVYILYVVSYLIGITAIAGVILAYIARENAKKQQAPDWLIENFTWQIRTFIGLLIFAVLFIFSLPTFVLPFIFYGIGLVWGIYRIVKGWVSLANEKKLYH